MTIHVRRTGSQRSWLAIALLAFTIAASGNAQAATTTSSGTIVACVNHGSGALYLAHRCARRDKRLTWDKHGSAGASGPAGARGSAGTVGPRGATGPQGTASVPDVLPSHQSLVGAYGAIGNATAAFDRLGTAVSFEIPLASAPTPHFVHLGEAATAECPGTVTAPAASPGNLCIYEAQNVNVVATGFEDPITGATGSTVEPFGFEVVALAVKEGSYDESGSWAVTAP